MLTFDQARDAAAQTINETTTDWLFIEEATLEKPYGWCFFYQSRAFIETGDDQQALTGNSPLLVECETGRVVLLGTSRPVDQALGAYEAGFYRRYDLTITAVSGLPETVALLQKLRLTYIDPKSGSQRAMHTPRTLELALAELPCTFRAQNFQYTYEWLTEIDMSGCCTYQLIPCGE